MRDRREVRLKLTAGFDPSKTVDNMTELLRPFGYYERIILDFSNAARINPGRLYRLFDELSKCPHFNYVEIRIQGLRFSLGKVRQVLNYGARRPQPDNSSRDSS